LKTLKPPRGKTIGFKLAASGWNAETRRGLEKLIRQGAGKGLPVVFDFDNTIQHGDIQEATLGVLARWGRLTPANLTRRLSPSFRTADRGLVDVTKCTDILEYYKELLAPTIHGRSDPTPLSTGYAWAIEALGGLQLAEVVRATQEVCAIAKAEQRDAIPVTPGKTAFTVPRFYPEMVELLSELLRHEFDIWIISASNVWSVRWMVLRELNPRLRAGGREIAPDHVIGASTLLADAEGRLYKDNVLVKEVAGYAAMNAAALSAFRLTAHLEYPLPAYSGKVACIFDAIGRRPYLCAGDGPGDYAMLRLSQHRLWIARQGATTAQPETTHSVRRNRDIRWMVQASGVAPTNGFSARAISVQPPGLPTEPAPEFLSTPPP
jgi:phosphoserine phosphatase